MAAEEIKEDAASGLFAALGSLIGKKSANNGSSSRSVSRGYGSGVNLEDEAWRMPSYQSSPYRSQDTIVSTSATLSPMPSPTFPPSSVKSLSRPGTNHVVAPEAGAYAPQYPPTSSYADPNGVDRSCPPRERVVSGIEPYETPDYLPARPGALNNGDVGPGQNGLFSRPTYQHRSTSSLHNDSSSHTPGSSRRTPVLRPNPQTTSYPPMPMHRTRRPLPSKTVDSMIPAAISATQPAPVHQSWAKIRRWCRHEYAELLDTLADPTLPFELEQVENELGFRLPTDVRESYLIHDGQEPDTLSPTGEAFNGLFFGTVKLLTLEDALQEWKYWRVVDKDDAGGQNAQIEQLMRSCPKEAIQCKYSLRGWFPLATDGAGNYIGIDLSPGSAGSHGQVITFGREMDTKHVLAVGPQGWARFLADFASALEHRHAIVKTASSADSDNDELSDSEEGHGSTDESRAFDDRPHVRAGNESLPAFSSTGDRIIINGYPDEDDLEGGRLNKGKSRVEPSRQSKSWTRRRRISQKIGIVGSSLSYFGSSQGDAGGEGGGTMFSPGGRYKNWGVWEMYRHQAEKRWSQLGELQHSHKESSASDNTPEVSLSAQPAALVSAPTVEMARLALEAEQVSSRDSEHTSLSGPWTNPSGVEHPENVKGSFVSV